MTTQTLLKVKGLKVAYGGIQAVKVWTSKSMKVNWCP